jgi:hypothetical protein
MHRRHHWLAPALVALSLPLAGCGSAPTAGQTTRATAEEPAKVEPIGGTTLSRLTLTEDAAARIGLQTAKVSRHADGRPVVPYSALIYTPDGRTWVYVSSKPLQFVRRGVRVGEIRGANAMLLDGPRVGGEVVTLGAAELLGTEFGVDH